MSARIIAAILVCLGCACTATDPAPVAQRTTVLPGPVKAEAAGAPAPSSSLKVITLNLAHGRKDGVNQWLVSAEQTRHNLDEIAEVLRGADADVVALQEADAPSRWSGGFDHVAYLAEKAGFAHFRHTEHAKIWMGNYGTALLSRWPIEEALGINYPGTAPTATKGFTLARIQWFNPEAEEPIAVDLVSVHLDFSRKSVRLQQADELLAVLAARDRPQIIMGDFNSEWLAGEYMIEKSADGRPLHVYRSATDDLSTYKNKRLDWILLSRELKFSDYRVEQQALSDHQAVIATIELGDGQ